MIASIVGGVFGLFFMLIAGFFALAVFVFWIWMLIHAVTNKGIGDGEKIGLGSGHFFPALHWRADLFFHWAAQRNRCDRLTGRSGRFDFADSILACAF